MLEKEYSRQSHDSHVTCNASLTASDLEEKHRFDKETDNSHTSSTKSSINLLGLDYSSSEDESWKQLKNANVSATPKQTHIASVHTAV